MLRSYGADVIKQHTRTHTLREAAADALGATGAGEAAAGDADEEAAAGFVAVASELEVAVAMLLCL